MYKFAIRRAYNSEKLLLAFASDPSDQGFQAALCDALVPLGFSVTRNEHGVWASHPDAQSYWARVGIDSDAWFTFGEADLWSGDLALNRELTERLGKHLVGTGNFQQVQWQRTPARGLTIRPSRRRFAARLNSGVRRDRHMHSLIDQIESSLDSRLYFLSLYAALTVPDIAGALGSENGQASGAKYAKWFEQWVRPRASEIAQSLVPPEYRSHIPPTPSPLTGEACYLFRCSLLHQGRSQHPKSEFSRIIFVEPGATTGSIHYCTMGDVLCIDLPLFCKEIIAGARLWLGHVESDQLYQSNYSSFVRRHPEGLPPYIVGLPVVA